MTPTQEGEHTLDNLSRMMADESVSRARALRLLGAALVGGLLASMPGGAKAVPVVCGGPFPQECGKTCCTAEEVCCGKGGNAFCTLPNFICCGKGGNTTACIPELPICCHRKERPRITCAVSVEQCVALGGQPG